MTMSIGRLTGLQVVQTWQQSGNQIGVDGKLKADTLNALQVARQQLEGYVDSPDEKVVPVTYSGDDTVDGFYRIESVDVDASVGAYAVGVLEFRVSMTRLHGYAAPLIESSLTGATRTGTNTSTLPWLGLPAEAVGVDFGDPVNHHSRSSVDGPMNIFEKGNPANFTPSLYDVTASYWLPPASWYTGAATLHDTRTADVVVGRQTDMGPEDFRISNGVVRVYSGVAGSSTVKVEHWDGTAWRQTDWRLEIDGDSTHPPSNHNFIESPLTMTVLRSSPAAVSVRMTFDQSSLSDDSTRIAHVDVTVRRGSRIVEGIVTSSYVEDVSFNERLVLSWNNGTDHTSGSHPRTVLTDGAERETDDANGNRWVAASSSGTILSDDVSAHVLEEAQGKQRMEFGLTMAVGGGAASGLDTSQKQIDQYVAAQFETLRPVARG